MSSSSPAAAERRLQRVETKTEELSVAMATHGMQLSAVSAKMDTMIAETRALGANLVAHVKEDTLVERRVRDVEYSVATNREASERAAESSRNLRTVLWTGAIGLAGDVILQLLIHYRIL